MSYWRASLTQNHNIIQFYSEKNSKDNFVQPHFRAEQTAQLVESDAPPHHSYDLSHLPHSYLTSLSMILMDYIELCKTCL